MKQVAGWMVTAVVAAVAVACAGQAGDGGAGATPAAGAPTGGTLAGAPSGAARSVYDGVYTAEQATRGRQVQQRECGNCHSPGDWSQGRLLAGWNGQPVYALVDNIRLTMPMDGPGRLSMQQYTDIVAFILQLNEMPTGSAEMPADEAALRQINIEYRR